ncbi:MAG: ABC transporter permease [Anaerolineae bacterium]|nr:ABC transporter permease [Anaerolineae bacterium]
MNIFLQEFKMNFKSVVTWSLSIAVFIMFYMGVYPTFAADAELINEMMANFPPELLMAFGMDQTDLSTVLGFFSFIFVLCQVMLAIQAANYGFSILSVEERDLTADFLLAKPVRRSRILTSKLLAALTGLTITNAVVWISSFTAVNLFRGERTFETQPFILLLLSIAVFQLVFLALGMFISLLVKKVRNVTPYSMGLAFGMYVLSAFGDMLGDAKLELITPFKHFEPHFIVNNGNYDLPLAYLSVSFIVVAIVGSYVLYSKRNIASAV